VRQPPASNGDDASMNDRLLLMHQVMLADRRRVDAFDRALARAVRPGDVVVDVGAGLLVLSLLALRHGARRVYALEGEPETAALAREIVARNGLEDRVVVVDGDARLAHLPERCDVLVSEMMGNLGPEEEMAAIVAAVARHNLKPGARVVPDRLVTRVQAVELREEGWGVWQSPVGGYSLEAVREYASGSTQLHFFHRRPRLLSDAAIIADSRMGAGDRSRSGTLALRVNKVGTLHAIVGYFTATLAPGIELSNFPSYPNCNWAVCVWPMQYTDVVPGDEIRLEVHRPADIRIATDWRLSCGLARRQDSCLPAR
jgi:protein arginine N-methyltransferase 1